MSDCPVKIAADYAVEPPIRYPWLIDDAYAPEFDPPATDGLLKALPLAIAISGLMWAAIIWIVWVSL
jgi:hypothetical protein